MKKGLMKAASFAAGIFLLFASACSSDGGSSGGGSGSTTKTVDASTKWVFSDLSGVAIEGVANGTTKAEDGVTDVASIQTSAQLSSTAVAYTTFGGAGSNKFSLKSDVNYPCSNGSETQYTAKILSMTGDVVNQYNKYKADVSCSLSGATAGEIDMKGDTFSVAQVQGPFKVTVNYGSNGGTKTDGRYAYIKVNGQETKSTESSIESKGYVLTVEYAGSNKVDVVVGASNWLSLYDVVISYKVTKTVTADEKKAEEDAAAGYVVDGTYQFGTGAKVYSSQKAGASQTKNNITITSKIDSAGANVYRKQDNKGYVEFKLKTENDISFTSSGDNGIEIYSVVNGTESSSAVKSGTLSQTYTLPAGTYRIIGKSSSASKIGSMTVGKAVLPTAVAISATDLTIAENAISVDMNKVSFTLTATVTPASAGNKAVTWSSSNTDIATIDSNGKVTLKTAGTTTITATCSAASTVKASVTLTVTEVPVESVSITGKPESAVLLSAGTVTLGATVLPANASNKTVTWTSSDTSVATVANGTVTLKGAGVTTIKAAAGSKEDSFELTVKDVLKASSTATVSAGGSKSFSTGVPVTLTSTLSQTLDDTYAEALTYQWYKGSDAIDGATSSTYAFTTSAEGDFDYHVVITGAESGASVTSDTLTIEVLDPSNAGETGFTVTYPQAPGDVKITASGTTLTAGSTTLDLTGAAYLWKVNGVTTTVTTASYDGSALDAGVNYTITVYVTVNGELYSASAVVSK